MQITVKQEDTQTAHLHGGEYTTCELVVIVDSTLPYCYQQAHVCHAVIENYFPWMTHDMIEDLVRLLMEGLEQLRGEYGSHRENS